MHGCGKVRGDNMESDLNSGTGTMDPIVLLENIHDKRIGRQGQCSTPF